MDFNRLFYSIIVLLFVAASSCKKTDAPDNPYSVLDYTSPNNNTNPLEPDSNSIAGLQKNIFSKKCSVSGCHDGTFEPDYRTIQSTYSTLLFQNVNITTLDSIRFFNYRVIPYDTINSFLFERITTPTSDYMPSNGVRLPQRDINHIKTWIMNGARDEFGKIPVKPNLQPNVLGYIAFDSDTLRLDTVRVNNIGFLPFITPANINIVLPMLILDTADGVAATQPQNFTGVKIKFSLFKNDFTNATVINCTFNTPLPWGVWEAVFNNGLWPGGSTVYFRVYANDGQHATDLEFPRNETAEYYKTYYAFYVQ